MVLRTLHKNKTPSQLSNVIRGLCGCLLAPNVFKLSQQRLSEVYLQPQVNISQLHLPGKKQIRLLEAGASVPS